MDDADLVSGCIYSKCTSFPEQSFYERDTNDDTKTV